MRTESIATHCALCVARCGATATVDAGVLRALAPNPSHPTGQALCVKGKVAPELVYHPDRLLTPLKRTRPKGERDAGWQPIGWEEALDITARRLLSLSRDHGPESVVFSTASPSTSALCDSLDWIQRLRRAFGSPNLCVSMELCGWGRYLATTYTYGAPVPGLFLPDLEHASCILLWGYNPSVARLTHATATAEALRRGARLVVVDPRRVGLAHRADEWLRVLPGTDTALALAIAHVMIERGWFDHEFVRRWTNGPLLVRMDNGRLLRESDLTPSGDAERYVAWKDGPVTDGHGDVALFGEMDVPAQDGTIRCRPAFQLVADACRRVDPAVTGIAAEQVESTARLLWEARPVAYYAWSGVEQHADATQIARAIAQIHALTGSFDVRGGNVLFPSVPANAIDGPELLPAEQRHKALGRERRPLGPARWEFVTAEDFYTAALESRPYRARGLVAFGANLLLSQPDGRRGREALMALDFYVHADLFMNPTAELADIVLPVASPFESEALALGFEGSLAARSLVQLRKPLVSPRGEARSDLQIVFELATRLGLGHHFFDGDIEAAYRHQLEPSGIALAELRAEPAGKYVPLESRYRRFADESDGTPRGFDTPTRRIELYAESLSRHGYPPVPSFDRRETIDARFPLILTSAKSLWFCESQHRGLPSLRRHAPEPEVEIHPDTARARGIAEGDWVWIETVHTRVRARAKLEDTLDPRVICGQHGWWQACAAIGAPGYDPLGTDSANLNLLVHHDATDPISGSVALRSHPCNISRDGALSER